MLGPETLAVFAAAVCGAAGYFFREYQNRARPYVHIVAVDGGLVRRSDERPDTPDDLKSKLDGAYWIESLGTTPNVGSIHDAWDRADDYIRFWPSGRRKLDDVLSSKDKATLAKSLPDLFSTPFLDRLMECLLAGDRILFPTMPAGAEDNIPVFPGEGDEKGMVWLAFPQNTVSFGSSMHEEVMRAKAAPFLRILSSLDPALVHPVVQEVRAVGEKDYHIATEVEPKLKTLRDQSSRWVLKIYFANLSNKPLMIQTTCQLSVLDHPKRRFVEHCYVAVIRQSEGRDSAYEDAVCPLVVKGGEDITFAVITDRQQKEMQLGSSLREAFDRGQGNCRVHLHLTKVGLLSSQSVYTHRASFKKQRTPG